MSDRHPRLVVLTTTIIAMVLTVAPLPTWLAIVRPAFLVLTVLYWSIMLPRGGGIAARLPQRPRAGRVSGARCSASMRWHWRW